MSDKPDPSRPPLLMTFDASTQLLQARVLDPPTHPGLLARLDRFEILRVIGEGGMSLVLLARDPASDSRVAIKLLKPEYIRDPRVVHRFLAEARHMRKLEHTHIMPVLEVSGRPQGPYFVMPYMEGGSVAEHIRPEVGFDREFRGGHSDSEAPPGANVPRVGPSGPAQRSKANTVGQDEAILAVAAQVAEALGFAHAKGIIHRDLKPGNVLLDNRGNAFLADFGLGKTTLVSESIIDTGHTLCEGTAPYIAPEVANGRAGDFRCDIYSFGAMLYEMLIGQPPYSGESSDEVLRQVRAGPPPAIGERKPGAPTSLVAVAEGAMARELRERYADMADVIEDLRRIEQDKEPHGPHGQIRRRAKRLGRSLAATRARMIVIGLVLCVLGVAVGMWYFWTQPEEILLADDFSGSQLDTRLWHVGQTTAPTEPDELGNQQGSADLSDGALVLRAKATSSHGNTSSQAVWVDSEADLKKGDAVTIEIVFSAEMPKGTVAVYLTDSEMPSPKTEGGILLWRQTGFERQNLRLPTQKLKVVISTSSSFAAVYSGDKPGPDDLVSVSKLEKWRLRFLVSAKTSAGFPPGEARLTVESVTARSIQGQSSVIGFVRDQMTDRPVPGVTVKSKLGPSARTGDRGAYLLTIRPGNSHLIEVVADGYKMSGDPVRLEALPGHQRRENLSIRKIRFGYGDVLATIPVLDEEGGFAVGDGEIAYLKAPGPNRSLNRMSLDGQALRSGLQVGNMNSVVFWKQALYGLSGHPGPAQIWKIDPGIGRSPFRILQTQWILALACDGKRFWYTEVNTIEDHIGLHAVDMVTGKPTGYAASKDKEITGVAFGNNRLWVSSGAGRVYEVDPETALATGSLDAAIRRQFPGHYEHLSFGDGALWGFDKEMKLLCRIKVDGNQPSKEGPASKTDN